MNDSQLLLIDLSGIAHQLYHVSGNEPDPNFISTKLIERIRGLASAHPHAAVCCDAGKSFRADIDPTYKAQRDTENRAVLAHQMTLACETLTKDRFPIWKVLGFEADDLIATAVHEALKIDGATVLIASADKDLLQLVNGRVQQKKTTDGNIMDEAAVIEKFKVKPAQMLDYLCLVGDTSDNIKGAVGIGGVIASQLLAEHGTLEAIYAKIDKGVVPGITPARRTALQEFRPRWPLVQSLIALRTDAPIPFAEIAAERTAPPMEETPMMEGFIEETSADVAAGEARKLSFSARADSVVQQGEHRQTPTDAPRQAATSDEPKVVGSIPTAVPQVPVVYSGPVDFSQQLEPRTMQEAVQLADRMFQSRLFSAYGTPQAVLATVLAGRELGIPAMASLRAFHIIEGKPQLSAGTIQSLVLKSIKARYFRCTERTATRATFCTQRGDEPEMCLSYTIEEGRAAWQKDENAWNKSSWGRNPADMLVARASSKLARLVYPDVVSGLYDPEEFDV
jgi:5'-3' exonuclease